MPELHELSSASNTPAIHGEGTNFEGVRGTSHNGAAGVTGVNDSKSPNAGPAIFGASEQGEGVHGETNSTQFAAVSGIEKNPGSGVAAVFGSNLGTGAGIFGTSQQGEGVHGETSSAHGGAVGVNTGSGAGVFGFSAQGEGVHGETSSAHGGAVGVNKGSGAGVFGFSAQGEGVHGETSSAHGGAVGVNKGSGAGVFGFSAQGEGVHGETNSSSFAAVAGIAMNPSGTGAGIFGESRGKGPAGFFKGDVEVTGDVRLIGQDLAETFEVNGSAMVEPGTVMVIAGDGALSASTEPYDRCVAGVISGAGTFRPGLILGGLQSTVAGPAIALAGRVYCLVDADYGAITVGSLLTTSPTRGHAMSVNDYPRAFGAVIGKALTPLDTGRALIPVLVALH